MNLRHDGCSDLMWEEQRCAKLVNDSFSVHHCGILNMNDDRPARTQTHCDVSESISNRELLCRRIQQSRDTGLAVIESHSWSSFFVNVVME